VRATVTGHLRAPSRFPGVVAAGGDGQPAGRPVGRFRARLGRRLLAARREAASVWQAPGATRTQNGTPYRTRERRRAGASTGARSAIGAEPRAKEDRGQSGRVERSELQRMDDGQTFDNQDALPLDLTSDF